MSKPKIATPALLVTAALWVGSFVATLPALEAEQPQPLTDAVEALNDLAAKDAMGKDQPALTEAEVVAAIRGWVRDQAPPASDEVYDAFQKIAKTKQLPKGTRLEFTTRWIGYEGYAFDVWWVDLTIPTGERSTYTYRLRARMIESRPLPKAR